MIPSAPPAHATKIDVVVSYSGLSETISVTTHQTVQSLLELALNAFGIHANRHTQSLYDANGVEMLDAQSIEAAGIIAGAHLLLRPSQVKGGAVAR